MALDPEECRAAARRHREEAERVSDRGLSRYFEELADAYEELAEAMEISRIGGEDHPFDPQVERA
jgi:hypothetical protein